MSQQLRREIRPFDECICYGSLPPFAEPVFYNNFGTEVLRIQVNDLSSNDLILALADIPFLRDATRPQQTTIQSGANCGEMWLRWPLLDRQLTLEELRAADAAYRASLVCSPQRWRELANQLGNDPRWGWYFRNG